MVQKKRAGEGVRETLISTGFPLPGLAAKLGEAVNGMELAHRAGTDDGKHIIPPNRKWTLSHLKQAWYRYW